MSYLLMTGSTGLVGRYVLRQLLEQDRRVAVVVRGSKMESARQRIDTVMRHWEGIAGRALRRPVVLEGDLCAESLGADQATIDWVSRNCDTILHSAASMTFRPDKRGEPHRTNVGGTQNLLNFCRRTGIRRFHHVSTAYICGLREGRVYETDVDLGQQLGNVYEESKLAAEKLLREANDIDELTIYRPASVVGDSETGYCTSLHGFYLPLQLAYMISDRISPEEMDQRFFSRLGLEGHERKNLVPVDWLATAIVDLYSRPECHQNTYHLASPAPVTVNLIQQIIQRAIAEYSDRRPTRPLSEAEMAMVEQAFHDHMLIYQSHWRDDPIFDLTNTASALPHLPCPAMTEDVLLRVAGYPVEQRFTLGRYEAPPSSFCSEQRLAQLLTSVTTDPAKDVISVEVTGVGGGQWHLTSRDGRVSGAGLGLGPEDAPCFYLNADTYAALADGNLSVKQSISSGRLLLERANGDAGNCLNIFQQVLTSSEARQPVA